jgi:hypothetical protein
MAKVLPEKWEVNVYPHGDSFRVDVYDIGDGSGGYFKLITSFVPVVSRQWRLANLSDDGTWYTEVDCPDWLVGQITYHFIKGTFVD